MLAVNRRQKERRMCGGNKVSRTRLSVNPVLFPLSHTHPQTRSDTERNYLPVPYTPDDPRQHPRRSSRSDDSILASTCVSTTQNAPSNLRARSECRRAAAPRGTGTARPRRAVPPELRYTPISVPTPMLSLRLGFESSRNGIPTSRRYVSLTAPTSLHHDPVMCS